MMSKTVLVTGALSGYRRSDSPRAAGGRLQGLRRGASVGQDGAARRRGRDAAAARRDRRRLDRRGGGGDQNGDRPARRPDQQRRLRLLRGAGGRAARRSAPAMRSELFGLARLCQLALPIMRAQKSGRIVNVTSIGGKLGEPFGGLVSATKFAVEGLSDCLRMETAPFGIDVIVIEPGTIRTEWSGIASDSSDARRQERPPTPLTHAATPSCWRVTRPPDCPRGRRSSRERSPKPFAPRGRERAMRWVAGRACSCFSDRCCRIADRPDHVAGVAVVRLSLKERRGPRALNAPRGGIVDPLFRR